MGPLIVKPPPPLPKPRRIPEPVQRELPELKPSKILSHKRALQAVTALAITVGILLLAIIVSVVVMLKINSKGRPTCVKIYAETMFFTKYISIFTNPPSMLSNCKYFYVYPAVIKISR